MKSFGMKESSDYRAYVRGSKCAGCPKWGACDVKCRLDDADFEKAKGGTLTQFVRDVAAEVADAANCRPRMKISRRAGLE